MSRISFISHELYTIMKFDVGLHEFGMQIRMHQCEFIKQPSEYDHRRQHDVPLIHQKHEHHVLRPNSITLSC